MKIRIREDVFGHDCSGGMLRPCRELHRLRRLFSTQTKGPEGLGPLESPAFCPHTGIHALMRAANVRVRRGEELDQRKTDFRLYGEPTINPAENGWGCQHRKGPMTGPLRFFLS